MPTARPLRYAPFALALLLLAAQTAHAWLRVPYEDAQTVDRSTLIVIAHIKPGSLQYVDHSGTASQGHSWEYHATLVITKTLKGKPTAQEIPITLFYGIEALVEGKMQHGDAGQQPGTFPKGSIQLEDIADLGPTICADATQDNLWFLHQRSGLYGETPTGDFGMAEPGEIQPLALKDYFLCYLAPDPDAALQKYLPQHPEVAPRASRFLRHAEIQRIGKLPDAAERVAKILPYFQERQAWGLKNEPADILIAAGPEASGPPLVKLFTESKDSNFRSDILNIWAQTKYTGCVDTLIDVLLEGDKYFAGQTLEPDWNSRNLNSPLTRERIRQYLEINRAVGTLARIPDPRARPALLLTLKRWQPTAQPHDQLVEYALAALSALPPPK